MSEENRPRTHRRAVSYIDKSREFYAAQGYEQPYRWASFATVPFTAVTTALDAATVGVVTTAFPPQFQRSKAVFAEPSDPVPSEMFTDDLSWDKEATHTDDVGSFLPLAALHRLAAGGTIGAVGPRFYGLPTEYSQRRTMADAAEIHRMAAADGIDAMLLVPI